MVGDPDIFIKDKEDMSVTTSKKQTFMAAVKGVYLSNDNQCNVYIIPFNTKIMMAKRWVRGPKLSFKLITKLTIGIL